MASLNKVQIIGHIGADPEVRHTTAGDQVTSIRVACTETWTDKASGQKKESTEWVSVTFYRKLAEIAGKYLKKGSQVYVEGRLKTDKYTDKNGVEKYSTKVEASELKMLGGKGQAEQQPQSQQTEDADIPF